MQVKRIIITTIVGFFLFNGTLSYAIMSVPYGWYIEANAGATKIFDQNFPNVASTSTSTLGGNANLGYKFMPFFGMEIGYTQYANTTLKNSVGADAATVRHFSWDLALRGILPLSDNGVEILGKIGISRANSRTSIDNSAAATSINITSSSKNANTGLYLAAGAQYYFTPELAVVALWSQAQGNSSTGTLVLYSLGISYTVMC